MKPSTLLPGSAQSCGGSLLFVDQPLGESNKTDVFDALFKFQSGWYSHGTALVNSLEPFDMGFNIPTS